MGHFDGCELFLFNTYLNRSIADKGRVILSQSLGLCQYLSSGKDILKLKNWLSETWSNLAMVNYPYAADFLEPLPAWPVKVYCLNLLLQFVEIVWCTRIDVQRSNFMLTIKRE